MNFLITVVIGTVITALLYLAGLLFHAVGIYSEMPMDDLLTRLIATGALILALWCAVKAVR